MSKGALYISLLLLPALLLGAEQQLDWTLVKKIDSFTDQQICLVKHRSGAEVSHGFMGIPLPSVPRLIEWRINNGEIKSRLANDVERDAGTVMFEGPEYDEILTARRLRVRILTFRSTIDGDYSMDGLKAELEKCPREVPPSPKQDPYQQMIERRVQSVWRWRDSRESLSATIRIPVEKNGRIGTLTIVTSSGNDSFDRSLMDAVKRASPFPPRPDDQDTGDIELTFTSKGTKEPGLHR